MGLRKAVLRTCDRMKDAPLIGPLFHVRPKVSVIRLSGIITDAPMRRQTISHAKFEKLIEEAFDVHKLQAVALIINSPGGSAAQSALIGGQIRRLAEEKKIPVHAFVEDVAASGGYWLACAADEIYAQNVSIVGSIGVISASFGFQDLIGRYGIERRVHTSGKDKSFLDSFQSEKPEDVERLKQIQSEIHQEFIAWVKERRAGKLKGEDREMFEGRFWTGRAGLENGMVDKIGGMRETVREKYGKKIKFREFAPEKKLLSGLVGGVSLPEDALETLRARELRSRYGL